MVIVLALTPMAVLFAMTEICCPSVKFRGADVDKAANGERVGLIGNKAHAAGLAGVNGPITSPRQVRLQLARATFHSVAVERRIDKPDGDGRQNQQDRHGDQELDESKARNACPRDPGRWLDSCASSNVRSVLHCRRFQVTSGD